MHGEEEQAGGRLTDVVHVEVLGHRAGHRELQERVHGPGPVSTQPHADPHRAGPPTELGSDGPGVGGRGQLIPKDALPRAASLHWYWFSAFPL